MVVPGSTLADITTWVRRIIKTPSAQSIPDATIEDYVNRFYIYDVPLRIQQFELKRQYTFESIANIWEYQWPFTLYQDIRPPAYCDGIQIGWYQSNEQFYMIYPELVLNEQPIQGNGTAGPYTINYTRTPILRGFTDDLGNLLPYVYITATDAAGNQMYVVDNGLGVLQQTDASFQFDPTGTSAPIPSGTIDYVLGVATFTFFTAVPALTPIFTQSSPYSSGVPRSFLFFNNTIKLYPVPDRAYKIQCDAYITPAQFLNSASAVPFTYMSEYLARGAARKILSDAADYDQFQFYEPLFREQENLVLRRSDRIRAEQRTPTIFSAQTGQNPWLYTQY